MLVTTQTIKRNSLSENQSLPTKQKKLLACLLMSFLLLLPISAYASSDTDYQNMKNEICKYVKQQASQIDLSSYSIFSIQEMLDAYKEVLEENPDIFYTTGSSHLIQNGDQYTLTIDYFDYTAEDIVRYENKVAQVLNQCIKPDMDDFEKALVLHDYISLHVDYDFESYQQIEANPYAEEVLGANAYSALIDELAVCQGYSEAYQDLLLRCGIPSVIVDNVSHSWNQVYLYGNWYHVDTTWDHPTNQGYPDIPGRVLHKNFLCSDTEIMNTGHTNWTGGSPCQDNSYENAYCKNTKSSVVFDDYGFCYYLYDSVNENQSKIMLAKRDRVSGNTEFLFEQEEIWDIPENNSFWSGIFSYLSEYDGDLFFNGKSKIYRMNLDSDKVYEAYNYNGDGYFLGCKAADQQITVITGYNVNECRDKKVINMSDLLHLSNESPEPVTVTPEPVTLTPEPVTVAPETPPAIITPTEAAPVTVTPAQENTNNQILILVILVVSALVVTAIVVIILLLNNSKKKKQRSQNQYYNYNGFGNSSSGNRTGSSFNNSYSGGFDFGNPPSNNNGSNFNGSSSGGFDFGNPSSNSNGSSFNGSSSGGFDFGNPSSGSNDSSFNGSSSGGFGFGNSSYGGSDFGGYPGYNKPQQKKKGLFSKKK